MLNSTYASQKSSSSRVTLISLGFIFALIAAYFFLASLTPHGQWDAFAIWNVRAKFIALGVDPFHYEGVAHPEYPILMPLIIAAGYQFTSIDSTIFPILFHGIIFIGILFIFLRNPLFLLLVGLVTLPYTTYQFADVPLALTLLLATVAYMRRKDLLVGLALGVGLHVKNEGALIALAFMVAWVLIEHRIAWRALIALAVLAGILFVFKAWVNIPNDVVGSGGIMSRLLDLQRYPIIIGLMLYGTIQFGTGILAVLPALIYLRGYKPKLNVALLAIVFTYIGYFLIYVITPHDVYWHIDRSYDRLLIHLFPALVYALITHPRMSTDKTQDSAQK